MSKAFRLFDLKGHLPKIVYHQVYNVYQENQVVCTPERCQVNTFLLVLLPSNRFTLGMNFDLESGRICIPERRILFDRCWSPSHHFKKGYFGLFIRSHCNPTNYFHFLLIPFPSFQIEKGALDVFDRGLCGQHFFRSLWLPFQDQEQIVLHFSNTCSYEFLSITSLNPSNHLEAGRSSETPSPLRKS